MKSICGYLQGTKDKNLLFIPYNRMATDCYVDAYFAVLWGHDNPQGPIFVESSTRFVTIFSSSPLVLVLKLQAYISVSISHNENMALSCFF